MSMKKALFCLLTVVMVLGCLGVQAFAEDSITVKYVDAAGTSVAEDGSLAIPADYAISGVALEDGALVVTVAPTTKAITLEYWPEDLTAVEPISEVTVEVDADATAISMEVAAANLPEGYELVDEADLTIFGNIVTMTVKAIPTEKTIYVAYVDEAGNVYGNEELVVPADATTFSSNDLTAIPEGYELVEAGDFYIGDANGYNVKVRPIVVEPTTKAITLEYWPEDLTAVEPISEVTVEVDADATAISMEVAAANLPEGYELVDEADLTIFGNIVTMTVKAIPTEKTIYVAYVDEAGNVYGNEELVVPADATTFSSNDLTAIPEGYELVEVGDFYIGNANGYNVKVRPIVVEPTTKAITLEYWPEDLTAVEPISEVPFEVDADATAISMEVAAANLPEGYELVDEADLTIYGDIVTMTVKAIPTEKTIYVAYVDEAGNVYGNEELVVPVDATYFNSGDLTAIPEGYELVEVGDFYFGEGNGYNVKVRPIVIDEPEIEEPDTVPVTPVKPVKPVKPSTNFGWIKDLFSKFWKH